MVRSKACISEIFFIQFRFYWPILVVCSRLIKRSLTDIIEEEIIFQVFSPISNGSFFLEREEIDYENR